MMRIAMILALSFALMGAACSNPVSTTPTASAAAPMLDPEMGFKPEPLPPNAVIGEPFDPVKEGATQVSPLPVPPQIVYVPVPVQQAPVPAEVPEYHMYGTRPGEIGYKAPQPVPQPSAPTVCAEIPTGASSPAYPEYFQCQ